MIRFVLLAGLFAASFGAQAQAKMAYVNKANLPVLANPLDEDAKGLGHLRATDSVVVDGARRLPAAVDGWVFVNYPAYASTRGQGGWVLRRYLVGQRDSVTVKREPTNEEIRAQLAASAPRPARPAAAKARPRPAATDHVQTVGARK